MVCPITYIYLNPLDSDKLILTHDLAESLLLMATPNAAANFHEASSNHTVEVKPKDPG
jgi:hypothetical protein